jgi:hypothetical protein
LDNVLNKSASEQSWLEKIAHHLPGFSGYADREGRRDADKLQRDFLANQLVKVKSDLQETSKAFLTGHNMGALGQIDHVANLIDKVQERIRHASYGYGGFFDAIKINAADLDRVYQFDLQLAQGVAQLNETAAALHQSAMANGDPSPAPILIQLDGIMQNFDRAVDQRQKVLMGVA